MSADYFLLFAIVQQDPAIRDISVKGLADADVLFEQRGRFVLAYQSLSEADVHTLFPADYGDDPDRLAEVVHAFQSVQEAVGMRVPLVSFRFGTIVLTRESVWSQISAHVNGLLERFQKIRGHQEWGLQILEKPVEDAQDNPSEVVADEKNYLRALAAAKQSRDTQISERSAFLEGFEERLMGVVADHVELNPGRMLEDGRVVRINLSLLVQDGSAGRLANLIEHEDRSARGYGLALRLTGPWPPQSFSSFAFDDQALAGP